MAESIIPDRLDAYRVLFTLRLIILGDISWFTKMLGYRRRVIKSVPIVRLAK